MSEASENVVYEFDGFRVDVMRRQLLRGGDALQLTAKALDTLIFLVRNQGSTVTKAELMNAVWPDSSVEENNLTQQISALRRILGERPNDHRFIVTVPGRGYCFVAEVDKGAKTPLRHAGEFRNVTALKLDAAAIRGSAVAFCYIALVGLAFLWSALAQADPTRPQSLTVLNFKASERGDESIGVGISETLRARLGSVEDLTVRPAPASPDALDAGRQVNVDTVVTGSVQRDHGRIRITVEMLDVTQARIVWGKTFDGDASNIFALQDAIFGEVARALNINISNRGGNEFRIVPDFRDVTLLTSPLLHRLSA